MNRLNLVLDDDTAQRLSRHAKKHGEPLAKAAKRLIQKGISDEERVERERKLAADYAAGRAEARDLLADLEGAQGELLEDEER